MFDVKKYNSAMKKLTIAELILSAVTFLCILFLFVLPCFKASVSLDGISLDILLLESENAEQKIFYDKVRAALRAEIANGNDPEIVTFSFSIVEEIKLMIAIFKSGTPGPEYLFCLVLFLPVALGATYLFMCANNIVKSCKKLFSDDIGNATLSFFNDIKASGDKKTKKSAYEQYQAFNLVIVIAMILFMLHSLKSLGGITTFVALISGITAAGYFALLLAIVACVLNFYTNKQKKALKTELLKADYEDRRSVEAALQHSPFDLNAPAEYASQQQPYPPQTPINGQALPQGQPLPPNYMQGAQNMQACYPAQGYAPAGYVQYAQMPAEPQQAQQQPQPQTVQQSQQTPAVSNVSPASPTPAPAANAAPAKPSDTRK